MLLELAFIGMGFFQRLTAAPFGVGFVLKFQPARRFRKVFSEKQALSRPK